MRFFRVCRYDWRNGIAREYKKFLIALAIFAAFCADFTYRQGGLFAMYSPSKATMADYLYFLFEGSAPFRADGITPFRFPAMWLLVMLFPLFLVLYYPYTDLMGYGKQVLINSGSRTGWWFSKCFWVIGSIGLYYLLLWLVVGVFSLAVGAPFSTAVSPTMWGGDMTALYGKVTELPAAKPMGWQLLGAPLLVTITMGLVQLVLSLIIRPLYSFFVSVAVLLLSTYYQHAALIGGFAMARRSEAVSANGLSAVTGAVICAVLSVAAMLAGTMVFRRYDILNKEG